MLRFFALLFVVFPATMAIDWADSILVDIVRLDPQGSSSPSASLLRSYIVTSQNRFILPGSIVPPTNPIRGQLADFGDACKGYPVSLPWSNDTVVPPRIANPWYPDLNYIALVYGMDSPNCSFSQKLTNIYSYIDKTNRTLDTPPRTISHPHVIGILFWDDTRPLGTPSINGTLNFTSTTPASKFQIPQNFTSPQNATVNVSTIPIMVLDPDYGKAYRDLLTKVNDLYNGSLLLKSPNFTTWNGQYAPTDPGVLLMATLFGPSIQDGDWSSGASIPTTSAQDSTTAALIYRQSLFIAAFLVFSAVTSTLVVWFIRSKRMRASRTMDLEMRPVVANKPDTLDLEEIDRWYPVITYEEALEDGIVLGETAPRQTNGEPSGEPGNDESGEQLHQPEEASLHPPSRPPSPSPSFRSIRTNTPVCAVCLDTYQSDSPCRKLACRHVFHKDCVDEWLLERSSRCPICRENCRLEARAEEEEPTEPETIQDPSPEPAPLGQARSVFSSMLRFIG